MERSSETTNVLNKVGPRLRRLRAEREVTLVGLSEATGISKSTLSAWNPVSAGPAWSCCCDAQAHQLPLDELVGAHRSATPGVGWLPARSTA